MQIHLEFYPWDQQSSAGKHGEVRANGEGVPTFLLQQSGQGIHAWGNGGHTSCIGGIIGATGSGNGTLDVDIVGPTLRDKLGFSIRSAVVEECFNIGLVVVIVALRCHQSSIDTEINLFEERMSKIGFHIGVSGIVGIRGSIVHLDPGIVGGAIGQAHLNFQSTVGQIDKVIGLRDGKGDGIHTRQGRVVAYKAVRFVPVVHRW